MVDVINSNSIFDFLIIATLAVLFNVEYSNCIMWAGKLLLSFGTVMFGIAFALSREAMSYLGPYSFNAIYSIVGCFILILCRSPLKRLKPDEVATSLPELEPFGSNYVRSIYPSIDPKSERLVNLLIFSVPFGMLQFFANTLGQIGLVTIQVLHLETFFIGCHVPDFSF